jgi:hypothetical protein
MDAEELGGEKSLVSVQTAGRFEPAACCMQMTKTAEWKSLEPLVF